MPYFVNSRSSPLNVMLETENNSLLTNDSGFVSGNGQVGAIPIYTTNREIKNSNLFLTPEGNLGINTQQPEKELHLVGALKADQFYGDGENINNLQFNNIVVQDEAIVERMIKDENITLSILQSWFYYYYT